MIQNYNQQLQLILEDIKDKESISNKFSLLRLITIIGVIVCCVLLYGNFNQFIFPAIILGLALFFLIVRKHSTVQQNLEELKIKQLLLENEIAVLGGGANLYDDGEDLKQVNQLFAHDMDLYGSQSLFHFINRTSTHWGKNQLNSFFDENAYQVPSQTIIDRQEAVKELSDNVSFSEKLQLFLFGEQKQKSNFNIDSDLLGEFKIKQEGIYKIYASLVPFLWGVIIFGFLNSADWTMGLTATIILLNFLVMGRVGGDVAEFMHHLNSSATALERLAKVTDLLGTTSFKSSLLQEGIKDISSQHFSKPILKLSTLIQQLDIRKNMMGLVVLYSIIPFDIFVVGRIRKWFKKNPDLFEKLFHIIGELEAYNSLAILERNHPNWTKPVFVEEDIILDGENMGHPLIFQGANGEFDGGVKNSYKLDTNNRVSIITGSNMSGKSTFIRVVGINLLLAFAGSAVCASSFKVGKRVKLITSMRIADSLHLSESTFKAELERIKLIIEAIETNEPHLFLVDEMLRGTNSIDKLKGSFALLEKLQANAEANIIVATHDLQLSDFEKNGNAVFTKNYHFDFDYSHNEFEFDYKLKEGVCEKFNASLLLKELGLNT
ncbi:hypothetical protein [Flammeovirga sp. SubArs3]|uniref:MutS-related protein n=1 Tax=Flammeovirga sp. SubArs3 TaxID=2995316 RepID=UPI00248BBDEB|nr:hypothetical protein [Flammeovirga sp. SubArs3]